MHNRSEPSQERLERFGNTRGIIRKRQHRAIIWLARVCLPCALLTTPALAGEKDEVEEDHLESHSAESESQVLTPSTRHPADYAIEDTNRQQHRAYDLLGRAFYAGMLSGSGNLLASTPQTEAQQAEQVARTHRFRNTLDEEIRAAEGLHTLTPILRTDRHQHFPDTDGEDEDDAQALDNLLRDVIRGEHDNFNTLERTLAPRALEAPLPEDEIRRRKARATAMLGPFNQFLDIQQATGSAATLTTYEEQFAAFLASQQANQTETPLSAESAIRNTQPNRAPAIVTAMPFAHRGGELAGCGGGAGWVAGGFEAAVAALGAAALGGPGGGADAIGAGGAGGALEINPVNGGLPLGAAGFGAAMAETVHRHRLAIAAVGLYASYWLATRTEVVSALSDRASHTWQAASELVWPTSTQEASKTAAPAVAHSADSKLPQIFSAEGKSVHATSPNPFFGPAIAAAPAVAFEIDPTTAGAIDGLTTPTQPAIDTSPTSVQKALIMPEEYDPDPMMKSPLVDEAERLKMPDQAPLQEQTPSTTSAQEAAPPETTEHEPEVAENAPSEISDYAETPATHAEQLPLAPKIGVRPAAGAYSSNAWAANTMFQLDFADRLGSYYQNKALPAAGSAWALYNGSRSRLRDDSGNLSTRGDKNAVMMGFDMLVLPIGPSAQTTFGVMGGYGHFRGLSRSKNFSHTSSGRVDGHAIGMYGTYQADSVVRQGLYVDGWMLWNRFDQNVKGGDLSAAQYPSRGLTTSLELGYQFRLAERDRVKYALQPRAQLIYRNVRAADVRESDGTRASLLNGHRVQSTLGLRAAAQFQTGLTSVVIPHLEINWVHSTRGDGVRLDDVETNMNSGRNSGQLKLGIRGEFKRHASLNVELFRSQGSGGAHETGGNLTANYRF